MSPVFRTLFFDLKAHQLLIKLFLALSIGAVLALIPGRSAVASITIVGGTDSERAAIQTAYTSIPLCCSQSCSICVRILADSDMDSYLQACAASESEKLVDASAVDGLFQNTASTITLRESDASSLSATFAHEFGHYVWLNVLSKSQRVQFSRLYKKQQTSHTFVTSYAAVSPQEDFAEAFSFYCLQKPLLSSKDSGSCCFLSTCLASGNSSR